MKNNLLVIFIFLILTSCAGVKVINPNDETGKDKGTKMVDWSGASPKIVSTYSCRLKSMGNRFSAIGKTEADARKEVVAKCHDRTLISNCKADEVTCEKN